MMFFISFLACLCCIAFNIFADVDIDISAQVLRLGQSSHITISSTEKLKSYKLTFLGKQFKLALIDEKPNYYIYKSYFAASRSKASGNYVLTFDARLQNDKHIYKRYDIRVDHAHSMKVGKVRLTKKAKKISKRKRSYQQEGKLLAKHFKTFTPKAYFDGPFTKPAVGRLSSPFAKTRVYNNGRRSSHAGVDISNKIGTAVRAAQHGKVILSERLKVHGNTVMIDHGLGVVSIYCHLHKRSVSKGWRVKKGDLIGSIGSTGVVSGPHLHWGLSIQNVRVNPLYWLPNTFK